MEELSNNFKFCVDCGKKISKKALSCPICGRPIIEDQLKKSSDNRFVTTLLLCWFLGVLGVHRFYSGHTVIGILQLITLGGCGIWTLIDFVIILTGNFKDSDGNKIKSN
tara:strand:+ start:196 stop:522 length:327 start_codon:yes stop_codon:yes gene_type:complete